MALNFKSYLKHFNRNRDINKVDAHSRSRQSVLYETILFNAKALRTMTGNTKLLLAGRAIDNKKSFKLSDNLYKKLNAKERLVNGFPVYDFESINFEGKGRYVLYLHGGTYAYQPTVLHWLFLERIVAEIPTHITMPIYPKAPTHTYKEAIDMICKVYEQLLSVTTADNIVVMGDSAGGGLTLALCEYLRENHYSQPLKTILLCPWVDVRCNNERIVDYVAKDPLLIRAELITLGSAYAGDKATDYYLVSPLCGDVSNIAPTYIFTGTHEILYPDAVKLTLKCRSSGVKAKLYVYNYMNHVFMIYPLPEAVRARAKIEDIIVGTEK